MKATSPARATVLVTSLFIGGLLCGALTGVAAVARAQDPYAHLDLFARVLTTIEKDYVDDVTADELVDAAIDGMVDHLDRQSRWLSADQMRNLEEDTAGNATSLGVEISSAEDGAITITRVLPGSPALRDGLAPGDRIVELDGKPLHGLELAAVRSAMQGGRGEGAILTVLRAGSDEPVQISTKRDRIHVPSVEGALFGNIAYIRLVQFQEGAAYELEQEFDRLARKAGGPRKVGGLVLDLRDNPGGLLTEAVAVSDLFLNEGLIVSTKGRYDLEAGEEHHARSGGLSDDLGVAILINGMSASASEIVAAALQETGRGTLVGEHTYGKGTVQQVYRHAGQTALKLTVGRYYTPSGAPVAAREGRKPDVLVPSPTAPTTAELLKATLAVVDLPEETRAEVEALLLELPEDTQKPLPIRWELPVTERAVDDPQLQAALAYLRPPAD